MTPRSNPEMVSFRMKRSFDTLHEVEVLIAEEFYHTAANRIYYACFYAVSALLLSENIKTKTHGGARTQFSNHFVQKGIIGHEMFLFYSESFDYRGMADYDDFIELEREKMLELYGQAKFLIAEIQKLLSEKK